MQRLIDDSLIQKYVSDEVTVNGKVYKPVFRYTNMTSIDTHQVHVGFRREDGSEELGEVFLPSIRGDGLLQRNKVLWYPVNLVLPPVCHKLEPWYKAKSYLDGLLDSNTSANRLTDFLPKIVNGHPTGKSILYEELFNPEGDDISDTSKWIVLDTASAILELFNTKITWEIERSQRGGWKGISATPRAINTILRAYIRYHGDEDEFSEYGAYLERDSDNIVVDEEELLLGKIGVEDKQGVLVIHPVIKEVSISEDTPIDFCTCSQARPMVSGRVKDGIQIKNGRFIGTPNFPYTTWRRAIPGILSDDSHRVLVGRAISRALSLEYPDKPFATTEVKLRVDSLSLLGISMTHPLNFEDGIPVSKTFAEKAASFKVITDGFSIPETTFLLTLKKQFDFSSDIKEEAKKVAMNFSSKETPVYVVRPGNILAIATYKDTDGNIQVREYRTKAKDPSIVVRTETFHVQNDLEEPSIQVRFVLLTYLPLRVGDKLADAHGNKGTVSAIYPDHTMPKWEGETCHYIMTPYRMKRLAVGAEIEDKLALLGVHEEGEAEVNSLDPVSMKEVDTELEEIGIRYTGTVEYEGNTYENVPRMYRRIFRLDNPPSESLTVRNGVKVDNHKRTGRNIRLALDMVTMLSRGAGMLAHELIETSKSAEYVKYHLEPYLRSIVTQPEPGAKGFEIVKRVPKELLGGPINYSKLALLDLEGTAADPIGREKYGYVKYKGKFVLMPRHEAITDLRNGSVMLSRTAIAINKVISEIVSEAKVASMDPTRLVNQPNVSRAISDYKDFLCKTVGGKNGLLRSALMPVFPHTIRGVFTPIVDCDSPFTIRIPRRAFKYLMKSSAEFKEMYRDPSMHYCIVKRDPVHRNNNVVPVKFELWSNDTIGIHPILLSAQDGDFDGDAGVAMFPITVSGWKDMEKMALPFETLYGDSKQLTGVPANQAMSKLRSTIGITSTFNNPHETDVIKHEDLLEELLEVPDLRRVSQRAISAAKDFECIKDGTAFCGALGLRLIYSRPATDSLKLDKFMELYHVLAQNTLDAKAGTSVPALEVVDGFNTGNEKKIRNFLEELNYKSDDVIDEVVKLSKYISKFGGQNRFMKYLGDMSPVTACIQSSTGRNNVEILSRRFCESSPIGTGIWDTLLEFITGKTEATPFDYVVGEIGSLAVSKECIKEKLGSA